MKDYSNYGIEIPPGRKSGHIKTFCPKCRDQRHNKRDRSLSVDLDNGLWKCHYCQWSGYLPKERNEMSSLKYQRKEYVKPTLKGSALLSEKVIKWFSERGISMPTLTAMKITEGKEWMPQKGKEVNTIQFNYYLNGELINTKFRTGDKCFKLIPNAELIPYNLDAIKATNTAIITEGECFRGDAEILTSRGFVRFNEYQDEDVAVVDDNLRISFKQPLAKIEKPYDGDMIEFKSKCYYSLTTPGHNMVFRNKNGEFFKKSAEKLEATRKRNWDIPTALKGKDSEGLDISSDMLKFFVAVSADFTIRPWGALYCCLKKTRKILRLIKLLNKLGIEYSLNRDSRGYASFYIRQKNVPQGVFKLFPSEWVGKLSTKQCRIILFELVNWDGNWVPNRKQIEYSTKEYHNASFIQTLAHMCGYNSTIMKRQNKYGTWYKVSILFTKKHINVQCLKKQRIHHNGLVYCVQVDTGMIVVRQNGIVSVTGNCDALSFYECGRTDVVSVPNGANANLSYLDDYLEEYFDDKETIYIASDTDTKGVMLRQELIRRFGPERCKVVEYGEGCKDANEHLVKYGKESLLKCLENATEPKIEGVFHVQDIEKPLDLLYRKGLQRGYTIGFENFDSLCSFETKRLCIMTGIPSAGKSAFLNFIAVRMNMLYDWKFAFFSPESMPIDYHVSTLVELVTGKKFGEDTLPLLEYEQAKEYCNDNFFFIYPESYTMGNILDKARSLVRRKGIKALVIDPYNRVESEQDYRKSETQHISSVLDQLTNFAQQNDVLIFLMAHPTKMPKNPDGKHQVPTLYDIAGSANFYNKADFGITVHRDKELGFTEIYVQKVKYRHLGQGGVARFKYDLFNSRYVPYEEDVPPLWDRNNYLAQKANNASMNSMFEPNTDFDNDLPF